MHFAIDLFGLFNLILFVCFSEGRNEALKDTFLNLIFSISKVYSYLLLILIGPMRTLAIQ